MSQAEAVSSPCRPLTNRPPVPDGTTLHYAVASTEAKLVFSDREATHAPPIWRSGYFGICGIILGVTKWTVVRFSNGLCFRVSHRANRLETNTKYEHPRQEESEPRLFELAFRSSLTLNSWSREKGLFRRGDQTQSGDARLVPRHERAPRTTFTSRLCLPTLRRSTTRGGATPTRHTR